MSRDEIAKAILSLEDSYDIAVLVNGPCGVCAYSHRGESFDDEADNLKRMLRLFNKLFKTDA